MRSARPRMLLLFCCQGGGSVGYHRAGYDVVGVDIVPQPRYPFPFVLGDALAVMDTLLAGGTITASDGRAYGLRDFDAIHASPPCQAYSAAQKLQKLLHPELIAPARERLVQSSLPYVIENVCGARADLHDPILLCGAMFEGLRVYRHRLFESNVPLTAPSHPEHTARQAKMGRRAKPGEWLHVVGNFSGVEEGRAAMGMPWATRKGLSEAVPPAYTEHVGRQLLA